MVAFNKKTEGGKQVSTHLSPRGVRTNSGQVHSVWVGVSAPKNAPTSLSATLVDTSVSIAFTAPTDTGGASITNYQYAVSTNGGSSYSSYVALSPADGVSPITVSGLTQNTAHLLKLKAVNDVGVSDVESAPVSFTSGGIPTSAPTSLSAIQTDTSVAISFTAAGSNSAITNYEYSFNNSTWTALSPADAVSPITISGLSQNTAYTVYLRGVTAFGAGPGSSGVTFTTFGPPTGTTTITSVSPIGTTTATVNFSTTAGGSAITGYDYYLTSWVNAGVSTSPLNLSGLTQNTAYVVYMRPKNAYGIGPQSAGFSFSTASATTSVQSLVVAGGGGSGGASNSYLSGGGGGAGGLRTSVTGATSGRNSATESALNIALGTTVTVTVGGGGGAGFSGGGGPAGAGGVGGASQFSSIVSNGGGGGGAGATNSTNGPSAGGSGGAPANVGTQVWAGGTAGQGWGGYMYTGTYSGGGGGASNAGGNEGIGRQYGGTGLGNAITGTTLGYAGGGGGANNTPSGGVNTSSYGGGGAGGTGRDQFGTAGTANTGGGGGGPNAYGSGRSGAAGGSGIVIIRYVATQPNLSSISAGLAYTGPTITGGFKVYSFTGGTGTITF